MAPGGRTFVKICGITSLADARLAVRAGANALGFVLAGGPRRMTPPSVAAITSRIHPTVRRIGVFVDPDPGDVVDIVERASLDGVQLHGTEPRALIEAIRALAPGLFLVKAIRVGGPQTIDDGIALRQDGLVDAVMLDTKDPADLDARRPSIATAVAIDAQGPAIDRIVLAGGLTPDNVAALVRGVRPWGVDVSSGVEAEPGRKDPDRLRAFVRAVREAERA